MITGAIKIRVDQIWNTFGGAPSDAVVRFGCIAGSCKMTFNDGSVLISDAGVPL